MVAKRSTGIILVLMVLLLWGCQTATPPGTQVKISRATSGQTLEVLFSQSPQTQKVALIGVDAPWFSQKPWSDRAKQRLQDLATGKTVLLEFDVARSKLRSDGSKVNLAYVWLDGKLLNEQMIEEGLVLAKSRSPNTRYEQRLAHAQAKARLLGVGIWNPAQPMRQTPAEFRASQPR